MRWRSPRWDAPTHQPRPGEFAEIQLASQPQFVAGQSCLLYPTMQAIDVFQGTTRQVDVGLFRESKIVGQIQFYDAGGDSLGYEYVDFCVT